MAEYLEREELLRQLRLWHMHRNDAMPDHFHYTGIKAWLEAMPAEDVQPVKHGKNLDIETPSIFTCSVCGWHSWDTYCGDTSEYNYCPNCGTKMDGET